MKYKKISLKPLFVSQKNTFNPLTCCRELLSGDSLKQFQEFINKPMEGQNSPSLIQFCGDITNLLKGFGIYISFYLCGSQTLTLGQSKLKFQPSDIDLKCIINSKNEINKETFEIIQNTIWTYIQKINNQYKFSKRKLLYNDNLFIFSFKFSY